MLNKPPLRFSSDKATVQSRDQFAGRCSEQNIALVGPLM
jgi:hypothetical protein